MSKRIVITGGAGFIGQKLSMELLKKGYMVTIIDNLDVQVHGNTFHWISPILKNIRFVQGNILDNHTLEMALENQDYLVHLAAHTATGQSMYNIYEDVNVNVLGTAKILDYLVNHSHKIQKIVVASSRAVYGEGAYHCVNCGKISKPIRENEKLEKGLFELYCPHCGIKLIPLPTNENDILNPISIYGASKMAIENMVLLSAKAAQIPTTILRYQNVYGEGQSLTNPYTGILSIFAMRLLNHKPLFIFEDGKESRDFIYIDDVVKATIAAIENNVADYQIYNIGTGIRTTILEVADLLIQKLGTNSIYQINKQYRIGDIRHNFADITKAKQELGFIPEIDLNKGLDKYIEWFNIQEVPKDELRESLKEMERKNMLRSGCHDK